MKNYLFVYLFVALLTMGCGNEDSKIPSNEIHYTSYDGNIIGPDNGECFFCKGINIISNVYKDGIGVIKCSAPITAIENSAFAHCYELINITIPNSVTRIENGAFENCRNLVSITIPNSVTTIGDWAFFNCWDLTNITIPDSVTSIGDNAFCACWDLTDITIGDGVTKIGKEAFSRCSSLANVIIGNNVKTIGEFAFTGCEKLTDVTISQGVTLIGDGAFDGCNNMKNVYITDLKKWCDIEFITNWENTANPLCFGAKLFLNNKEVIDLVIPEGVTTIKNLAFDGCSSLKSVTIPNSVTKIENIAFSGCSNLTSITIPNSITMIGDYVFYNCHNLAYVYINDLERWCNIEFHSNPLGHGAKLYLNNKEINNLEIPNSIKTIRDYAFDGCSSLTSITIPNSVTTIKRYAFGSCSYLNSVTIPNSVTKIENHAFDGCNNLTNVYCRATIPPTIEHDVFYYDDSDDPYDYEPKLLKNLQAIYVPRNSVYKYKTANDWRDYAHLIKPYDFE